MPKRGPEARTLGGQWKAGDVAVRPPDTCVEVNNMLVRPGRIAGRPPFSYDSLMSINGLANFQDPVNRVSRLMAVDTSHRLYEKGATGETWSASLGAVGGNRLSGYANYLGKVWMMLDDGAGLPSAAASFDGTNISTSPFASAIQARDVIPYGERLVLVYPRVTVMPLTGSPLTWAYDWTNVAVWHGTNVTQTLQTLSTGVQECRVAPTDTTNPCFIEAYAAISIQTGIVGAITAATADAPYKWLFQALGTDPAYDVPITVQLVLRMGKQNSTAYVVGDLVASGNNFYYRCIVAGTSGINVPLGTVVNGTTVDGGATWVCVGSDVMGSLEDVVPSTATSQDFTSYYCLATVPPHTNSVFLMPRLRFYNTANPLVTTLAPIIISRKDGLADGDPRKANHGSQWTAGDFPFPFFNAESTAVQTVDINAIIYSEIRQPTLFQATNDYRVNELVGLPTGAAVNSKRLIVFWPRGFAQFTSNTDDNFPLRLERLDSEYGCLGPLAKDTFMDTTFFIADDDVYAYQAGTSDPQSILGDGMREIVMDHGAGWVNNPVLDTNRPILKIDKLLKIIYVYAQRGKLFAFNMVTKAWSTFYVSNGAEINAMLWNQNTGHFYVSFAGFGLALFDFSLSANDSIDNVGTGGAIDMNVVHIMESDSGVRTDAQAEMIQALYRSDIDQTGQVVTVSVSTDQGATYPHATQVTPVLVSTAGNYLPLPITTRQASAAPSLTFKIARSGKGGEKSWSLSTRLRIDVEQVGTPGTPERTMVNPVAGSAT